MDLSSFTTADKNQDLWKSLSDIKEAVSQTILANLEKKQPRDDYKEMLELVLIFLGEIPAAGVRFKQPGAFHHAPWMAKAIYTLKIFMFQK